MKVRKEDRKVMLLAAVVATCTVVAGISALFDPATASQEVARRPAYVGDSTQV